MSDMWRKIIMVLILFSMFSHAQNSLKGQFLPPEEFDWVLVYNVRPEASEYIGNARIDSEGYFEFKLDSTQHAGMYRLVYAIPQEEYNFDLIYNAKEDIEFTFHIDNGLAYKSSSENKLMTSYTNSMARITQSIGKFYRDQDQDTTALLQLFKTQRDTQTEFESIAEGTLALNFIKANRPYTPDVYQDIETYIGHIKTDYFKNVDFNNEILLSSNFLVERMLNFVFGMPPVNEDEIESYKHYVSQFTAAMEEASVRTRKTLLHILWEQFSESNIEEVANFIAENYLIALCEELGDEMLAENLRRYKNTSIGQKAPDFEILRSEEEDVSLNLYELDEAETYVLVFWSSSCSHCLEELPLLHQYFTELGDAKVKVIAFGLEDEEMRWTSETRNYPEFTHVIGLGKWENEVGNAYNIQATPTYFILDSGKVIINKPLDFESLKQYFESQK